MVIYGRLVLIDHGLGVKTLYAHLAEIMVDAGDKVISGQPIGKVRGFDDRADDFERFADLIGERYESGTSKPADEILFAYGGSMEFSVIFQDKTVNPLISYPS